jgi:hypothetical protein
MLPVDILLACQLITGVFIQVPLSLHLQEVMRHSRLQAEKSAHERNVVERDRFIAELAGRLGVNLPGAAGA